VCRGVSPRAVSAMVTPVTLAHTSAHFRNSPSSDTLFWRSASASARRVLRSAPELAEAAPAAWKRSEPHHTNLQRCAQEAEVTPHQPHASARSPSVRHLKRHRSQTPETSPQSDTRNVTAVRNPQRHLQLGIVKPPRQCRPCLRRIRHAWKHVPTQQHVARRRVRHNHTKW
jgi:hypothetical protein